MPELTEIDWEPKPMLRPGMDFREGRAYYTIPLTRNMVRMTKSKKGEDPEPFHYKELQTYVVPSEGKGFWYDEESLDLRGFVPIEQVYQERESRWSLPSARAFLDGKATTPTTTDLFAEVRDIYTMYVEYADETYYDVMSLFLMYTYVFRLFESTGYIHFNGTMASGKSRNLSILNALAFGSVWASSMSAPSLYRKLAGSPGTTLLDESEGFEGERGEELRRVLTLDTKTVPRLSEPKSRQTRTGTCQLSTTYWVFLKARLDGAEKLIQSRCLIVAMRPAIRELPEFETKGSHWQPLRDRLYLWAIANSTAIATLAQQL